MGSLPEILENPFPDSVKFQRMTVMVDAPTEDDEISEAVPTLGDWYWERTTQDGGIVVTSPGFVSLEQAVLNAQRTLGHPFVYQEIEYS